MARTSPRISGRGGGAGAGADEEDRTTAGDRRDDHHQGSHNKNKSDEQGVHHHSTHDPYQQHHHPHHHPQDPPHPGGAALDALTNASTSLGQKLHRRWGQKTLLLAVIALYALGGLWILASFTSTEMTWWQHQHHPQQPQEMTVDGAAGFRELAATASTGEATTTTSKHKHAHRHTHTHAHAHAHLAKGGRLHREDQEGEDMDAEGPRAMVVTEQDGEEDIDGGAEEEEEGYEEEEEEEEERGSADDGVDDLFDEEPVVLPGGNVHTYRDPAEMHRPKAFQRCGNWQEDYMETHRQILEGELPPRYLVAVVSQSGLADQIVGLMSLFFWAVLTKRAFQITVGHQPIPPLEEAFDAPFINWRRDLDPLVLTEHLYRPYTGGKRAYPAEVDEALGLNMEDYGSLYMINNNNSFFGNADLSKLPRRQWNRSTLFMASNRGRVFRLFDNPHHRETLFEMGLRPETAFACGFRFLFSPNEATRLEAGWQLAEERLLPQAFPNDDEQQAKAIEDSKNVLRIGIQVRVGDFVFDDPERARRIKLADYVSYFDCAEEIAKHRKTSATTKVLWYLVSDSQRLKELALAHYGSDLIVTSTDTSRHVICEKDKSTDCSESDEMAESLTAAASDMLGLAETDYIILTRKSGFGKVSAWLNMRWHNVWWLEAGKKKVKECGPRSYVQLEYMADKWSGL